MASRSTPSDTRCTPAAFARWLADPGAPRSLAYHEGFLARDRWQDPDLFALATAALHASGALPATVTDKSAHRPTPQGAAGPRRVLLTQQRTGEGRYRYVATKLPRARP